MARTNFVGTPAAKKFDDAKSNPNGGAVRKSDSERKLGSTKLLSYPHEAGSLEQGHFVLFQIHKLTSGKLGKVEEGSGFKRRSFALRGSTKTVETQIALYMPPQVGTTYKSNYENKEIGAVAEAGANAIGSVASGGSLIDSMGKVAGAVAGRAVGTVAGGIIDTIGPGAKELFQLNSGKIVTEKMELMFKGIERRQFTFSFAFLPKSEQEANQVHEIVKAFKIAMLPSYASSFGTGNVAEGAGALALGLNAAGTGGEGRTLTIPTTMDIKYFYRSSADEAKENTYLNKISTCYLTDMDVKYGGERFTAYTPNELGAPPQNTTLTLSFDEIEMITQEAVRAGY